MYGHGSNSLKLTAEDVFDMSQAISGNTDDAHGHAGQWRTLD